MPLSGGTVTATGSDGTRYTLTIPADALLDTVTVTMTPVAAATHAPLGGLTAAVQFAPEGLRFLSPATLTIEPAHGVSGNDFAGFGYHAAGDGLHLEPATASGAAIVLPIVHFSGAGVARATAAEVAAQRAIAPGSPEDAARQQIAGIIDDARRGGAPLDVTAIAAVLQAYYASTLRPTLIAAAAAGDLTPFQEAFALARQLALLNRGEAESAEIFELAGQAIHRAYDTAYARCRNQHDLRQFPRMLSLLRMATLIGDQSVSASRAYDCGTLRVEISATVTGSASAASGSLTYQSTNTAAATIVLAEGMVRTDTVGMTVSPYSYVVSGRDCSGTNDGPPVGTTFTVLSGGFDFDADTTHTGPALTNFGLVIGGQDGTLTLLACGHQVPATDQFWTFLRIAYVDDGVPPNGVHIGDWTVTGGAEYATARSTRTLGIVTAHLTLRLLHEPP